MDYLIDITKRPNEVKFSTTLDGVEYYKAYDPTHKTLTDIANLRIACKNSVKFRIIIEHWKKELGIKPGAETDNELPKWDSPVKTGREWNRIERENRILYTECL